MKLMKTGLMVGAAAAMLPAMAFAQTAPATGAPSTAAAPAATTQGLAVGAKVLDTAGGTVGSIETIDGDFAVVATSKSRVRLPKSSFAIGPNGPVIGMTADQLDQAVAQATPAHAAAAAKPNVVQGAAVSDMQGGAVGTIADVNAQFATVQLVSGAKVRLPINAFGAGANGGLRVAMTAQQLGAAAGASPSGGAGHSK